MKRKYLAFDIETAKTTEESDWRSCRPLGISRAATLVRSVVAGDRHGVAEVTRIRFSA